MTFEAGNRSGAETSSERSRPRRSDWRLGGRGVHRWDGALIATALVSCGVAVIASGWVGQFPSPWAPVLSLLILWSGLGVPFAFALARGVPAGLLRFRARDVLWGVCLGSALRIVQGVLSDANSLPFPSSFGATGFGGGMNALTVGELRGLIAPLFEELFFRAVVLVAVYQVCRRPLGLIWAGVVAIAASTLGFVCLHLLFAPLTGLEVLQLGLVGVTCAALTVATGRVWGAVLTHLIYNASFIGLAALGTI